MMENFTTNKVNISPLCLSVHTVWARRLLVSVRGLGSFQCRAARTTSCRWSASHSEETRPVPRRSTQRLIIVSCLWGVEEVAPQVVAVLSDWLMIVHRSDPGLGVCSGLWGGDDFSEQCTRAILARGGEDPPHDFNTVPSIWLLMSPKSIFKP